MGVVSFTPRPLYPQGKSPWYPLDRRLGGPQSCSGHGGEELPDIMSNSDVTRLLCSVYFPGKDGGMYGKVTCPFRLLGSGFLVVE